MPHEAHALGPFAGLVICLSGGTAASKAAMVKAVRAHGATQSPELTKQCTHLVICSGGPRTESAKEKYAYPHPWLFALCCLLYRVNNPTD